MKYPERTKKTSTPTYPPAHERDPCVVQRDQQHRDRPQALEIQPFGRRAAGGRRLDRSIGRAAASVLEERARSAPRRALCGPIRIFRCHG